MGSVKEEIAKLLAWQDVCERAEYKDKTIEQVWVDVLDEGIDDSYLVDADQILSLVCKRIEGVENPFQVTTRFNDPRYLDKPAHDAFEKARQAILDAIKEE